MSIARVTSPVRSADPGASRKEAVPPRRSTMALPGSSFSRRMASSMASERARALIIDAAAPGWRSFAIRSAIRSQ